MGDIIEFRTPRVTIPNSQRDKNVRATPPEMILFALDVAHEMIPAMFEHFDALGEGEWPNGDMELHSASIESSGGQHIGVAIDFGFDLLGEVLGVEMDMVDGPETGPNNPDHTRRWECLETCTDYLIARVNEKFRPGFVSDERLVLLKNRWATITGVTP